MPGLDPPAGPKPLRRGEGPGIHVFLAGTKTWMAGTSPAMTNQTIEFVPFFTAQSTNIDDVKISLDRNSFCP
jgi:hypothetical protein